MLVVTDGGESLGVLDKQTALNKARELESDLVLINPQATPPVAKIIAWSKFKYEQSKKKKKAMKNKGSEVKEMWFKPFIELGDMEHKVGRIKEFLEKGNKVKITIRAGRGPINREKMSATLEKVLEMLNSVAEAEGDRKQEGRNVIVFVKHK
ncbi:MAG: translation initiation factor IF-3 [Candidatus Doudnabacteria bacterium]|nr:translation initiation factor IF-3 [Candidatus Doudnabacteria bacterium]